MPAFLAIKTAIRRFGLADHILAQRILNPRQRRRGTVIPRLLQDLRIVGLSSEGGIINTCHVTGSVTGRSHNVDGLTIKANAAGGLCGWNYYGKITNCQTTCEVSGEENVGGLCGESEFSDIEDCSATGAVAGVLHVGGLCGESYKGIIRFSFATGSVEGDTYVGGLCGVGGREISQCFTTGEVIGRYYVGGICGAGGGISQSYTTGTITGSEYVGGMCGLGGGIYQSYATGSVRGDFYIGGLCGQSQVNPINDSYASGDVTGVSRVGGLCGMSESIISRSYATGFISGSSNVGALVGLNYKTNNACFWDVETSGIIDWQTGQDDSDGMIGLSTEQMQTMEIFANAGWDFSHEDENPAVWMMLRPGEDYPRLEWQEIFAADIRGLYGVNIVDFVELAEHWNQSGCPMDCEDADINGDGGVGLVDLRYIADDWLLGL